MIASVVNKECGCDLQNVRLNRGPILMLSHAQYQLICFNAVIVLLSPRLDVNVI
jgi:hypothetical protein